MVSLPNAILKRVVSAEEAESLINQGYTFVGTLPNGKVIVSKRVIYAETNK